MKNERNRIEYYFVVYLNYAIVLDFYQFYNSTCTCEKYLSLFHQITYYKRSTCTKVKNIFRAFRAWLLYETNVNVNCQKLYTSFSDKFNFAVVYCGNGDD